MYPSRNFAYQEIILIHILLIIKTFSLPVYFGAFAWNASTFCPRLMPGYYLYNAFLPWSVFGLLTLNLSI